MKKEERFVCILRVRPPLMRETQTQTLQLRYQDGSISLPHPRSKLLNTYRYDFVFDQTSTQAQIFEACMTPHLSHTLQGFNIGILAYGITGSGKTYTIMGKKSQPGLLPLACKQLFKEIESDQRQFLVRCSFVEVYKEKIRDLLTKEKSKVQLRQHAQEGVMMIGASMVSASSLKELMKFIQKGISNRAVSENSINQHSSRSHAIFNIHLESRKQKRPHAVYLKSRIQFCDLAGSQRVGRRHASKASFDEGVKINLSLNSLSMVIEALANQHKVNYRGSKLTRLLQQTLGGNSKTLLIGTISRNAQFYDESVSTLQFTTLARKVKTIVERNYDRKDLLLQEYHATVQRLKYELRSLKHDSVFNDTIPSEDLFEIEHSIIHPTESLQELRQEIQNNQKKKKQCLYELNSKRTMIKNYEHGYQSISSKVTSFQHTARQLRSQYDLTQQKIRLMQDQHHDEMMALTKQVSALTKQLEIYKSVLKKLNGQEYLVRKAVSDERRSIEVGIRGESGMSVSTFKLRSCI